MLPADRAIAAIESVFCECFRSFAKLPGGEIIETAEVSGVVNDVPIGFFNGIGRSQLRSVEAIDPIVEIFRRRGRAFRWWISPSVRPDGLAAILRGRGFRHVYDSSGMAADLTAIPLDVPPPAGLTIRKAELQLWAEILLNVFQRPPHETASWVDAYTHLDAEPGPWRHFVGWADGEAVATSSVLVSGALAGIYHVATLPRWRGRGFGAALTLEALRYARAAGATEAVLQASDMGLGVYRAIGFAPYCDLTLYDWQP